MPLSEATDFKSVVSTYFTTRARKLLLVVKEQMLVYSIHVLLSMNLLSVCCHIHQQHYPQIMGPAVMIKQALLQITCYLLGYVTIVVSGRVP